MMNDEPPATASIRRLPTRMLPVHVGQFLVGVNGNVISMHEDIERARVASTFECVHVHISRAHVHADEKGMHVPMTRRPDS